MATPAPQGRPPQISDDQTSIVVGNACMVIVLCSVAVAGRFSARWMVKARIEADDHLSLTALVRGSYSGHRIHAQSTCVVCHCGACNRTTLSYVTLLDTRLSSRETDGYYCSRQLRNWQRSHNTFAP